MPAAETSRTPPHVRVFVDDDPKPLIDHALPTQLALDTRQLADGPHRLIIRAEDQNGAEGFEELPFHVQNGPGILVSGLRPGATRSGMLHLTVDAFSTDDPFDPRRAEARSSIPAWVWVLCLFVLAWTVWYAARMWEVPPAFMQTPTFAAQQEAPPAPPPNPKQQ